MKRLIEKMVPRGSMVALFSALRPMVAPPPSAKWTTEGIEPPCPPSGLRTTGRPSFQVAASEFVVPRSIPSAMGWSTLFRTLSSM